MKSLNTFMFFIAVVGLVLSTALVWFLTYWRDVPVTH
jgi:hypothetical protein